jgi:uncharacterized protein with FMN-binding domain
MLQGLKYTFAAIVVFAVIVTGVTFATGGVQWITAPFRGSVEANEQTTGDGSYRNATYNHFYNLCSSVMSKEDSIENLELELESGVSDARASQIQESITALRNSRSEAINEYNTDSAKETREFMKDSDLPERLDENADTECTF